MLLWSERIIIVDWILYWYYRSFTQQFLREKSSDIGRFALCVKEREKNVSSSSFVQQTSILIDPEERPAEAAFKNHSSFFFLYFLLKRGENHPCDHKFSFTNNTSSLAPICVWPQQGRAIQWLHASAPPKKRGICWIYTKKHYNKERKNIQ